MRVLMTADAVGGVWTYALTLIRALADFGVHVTLAVLGPAPTQAQVRDLSAMRNAEWCHHAGPLEWMIGGAEAVDEAREWLLSIAARTSPDIVHLNGYSHAVGPFPCPVIVVAHSCICSWFRAVTGNSAPERYDPYRRGVLAGLHAADVVIAPTRAMLDAIAREYGLQRPGRVIANGSDATLAASCAKEPLVFSAARFDDRGKNLAALQRASGSIEWPVVVAGDNGDATDGRNITYLGRIDYAAVQRWLTHASIYALPARYEPFGLSILEAAQCRCALVLGDIPSLREVWGAAAVYVDPDDPDALQYQVNKLVHHTPWRRRMANAARHRAARYTARACAHSYFRTYQSLVDGLQPDPPTHSTQVC